jgi:hypothetical protein
MKKIFIILVYILLIRCTENESQNVILPKLISASASLISTTSWGDHIFEIKGNFRAGQSPVQDIKIALGVNTTPNVNPKSLFIGKSVELLDSDTFRVQFQVDPDYTNYVSFYFISEKTCTYSETYAIYMYGADLRFVRIFPEKR